MAGTKGECLGPWRHHQSTELINRGNILPPLQKNYWYVKKLFS